MSACPMRVRAWLSGVRGAAGAPAAPDSQAKKPGPFDSREQFEANLLKQARPPRGYTPCGDLVPSMAHAGCFCWQCNGHARSVAGSQVCWKVVIKQTSVRAPFKRGRRQHLPASAMLGLAGALL